MIRTKLLGEQITTGQSLILGAWYLNLLAVVVLWATTSGSLITSGGVNGIVLAVGQLFGLLAVVFALTQFLLMGRILWIERRFGLDHLAAYHRLNGYAAIIFILLHTTTIILAYSLRSGTNYFSQYINVVLHYDDGFSAFLGQLLFLTVVGTSIYIVRRKLKFESWYYVHLLAYAAIVSAFFHQLTLGSSFQGHPLARLYWYALYASVALAVLFWRFTLPSVNLLRFGFKVSRIVAETPTTTSIYIAGHNLDKWRAKPGQFVLVRFLKGTFLLQEHPFSLSQVPENNEFRITVRHSGDYTSTIQQLQLGTPVLVSGPFGRFTAEVAITKKRLFIAGGVGITPLRTMAVEALASGQDSVLVYGNKTPDDIVFEAELAKLKTAGLKIITVFSDPPDGFVGHKGYVTAELIEELVPDYKQRDVYLCGPPPMMSGIVDGLTSTDLSPDQLHFERFALHN